MEKTWAERAQPRQLEIVCDLPQRISISDGMVEANVLLVCQTMG